MLVEIDARRGPLETPDGVVVLISLAEDAGPVDSRDTVADVAAGIDAGTPIVVIAAREQLDGLEEDAGGASREIIALARGGREPGPDALELAFGLLGGCDVALIAGGVRVPPGWVEGLRAAAHSESSVASATPLSLGAGGIEIAAPSAGEGRSFGDLAAAVRDGAPLLWPRIAGAGPCCAYLRREAIELAAPISGPGVAAALSGFSERTRAAGLLHLVADDVLVDGRALRVEGSDDPVRATIEDDGRGALRRSRAVAGWALRRPSVTVDCRALISAYGGTQTYLLGVIGALAEAASTEMRVLIPPDISPRAHRALERHPALELVSYEEVVAGVPPSDVVHRPQQAFTVDDLKLLRLAGDRLVIGQQDLIGYHNPTYHASVEDWRAYRRVTRISLGAADQVVFFSEHARRDALAEDLLEPARAHVIGIGAGEAGGEQRAPAGVSADEPFLLCLGADYAHKNRPFAIELQRALQNLGWQGRLLLAGAHVPYGSSAPRERELLAAEGGRDTRVLDLGPVEEPERRWLLAHARALLYPTLYEGFGLLPAEAAEWGVPCLFAAQTSLGELAGEAATLVRWDAHASAAAVLGLLEDGDQRSAHMRLLESLAVPSWEQVAEDLLAVYRLASLVPSPSAPGAWEELEREREISEMARIAQEYQDAYHALERRVAGGLPLIDQGGLLSAAQQRGLMRVASRRLGSMALAPLELLGRRAAPPGAGGSKED